MCRWMARHEIEIPESTAVTVRHDGVLEPQAFTPRVPASATHA